MYVSGGIFYIIRGGMIYDMVHSIGGMIHILDPKYDHILDLKVHPIDALRGVWSINGGVQVFDHN